MLKSKPTLAVDTADIPRFPKFLKRVVAFNCWKGAVVVSGEPEALVCRLAERTAELRANLSRKRQRREDGDDAGAVATLDFSAFYSGDADARRALGTALFDSLREVGFATALSRLEEGRHALT